jgi:hypothetical protein
MRIRRLALHIQRILYTKQGESDEIKKNEREREKLCNLSLLDASGPLFALDMNELFI